MTKATWEVWQVMLREKTWGLTPCKHLTTKFWTSSRAAEDEALRWRLWWWEQSKIHVRIVRSTRILAFTCYGPLCLFIFSPLPLLLLPFPNGIMVLEMQTINRSVFIRNYFYAILPDFPKATTQRCFSKKILRKKKRYKDKF